MVLPVSFFLKMNSFSAPLPSQGGSNPSALVDQWAANRLNKFCEFKGWHIGIPFEEMPGQDSLTLLSRFFQ